MSQNRTGTAASVAILLKNRFFYFLIPILIGLAVWVRIIALPQLNTDLHDFVLPWYRYILSHGRFFAFKDNFSNYTPPYLYLLTLASYLNFLPDITVVKLVSIVFDFVGAWLAYRIVISKCQRRAVAWTACLSILLAPTVMVVSAYWGQADMIYTVFVLACLYFVLQDKPFRAMLFFSIAFSIKLQAIFIAPLLLIQCLRKNIPWYYLLLPAPVYFLLIVPAWIAGRPLLELLRVYLDQADTYHQLSMNAPNLYTFTPNTYYNLLVPIGLVVTVVLMLSLAVYAARTHRDGSIENLLLEAVLVSSLVPFFLPKMHERYFFLAALLMLLLASIQPRYWICAVLFQVTSLTSYLPFLMQHPHYTLLKSAAVVNTGIIIFLLASYIYRGQRIPSDPNLASG